MIIVLIGSPLSGKTTLLKRLQENGARVFSGDSHITKIYKAGEEGYNTIKENLGEEFVNEVSVDKRKLAEWASIDENLQRLNELIHPLIYNYLEGKDNYIAELPIVTNSPVKFKYDKLILVRADKETITERFAKTRITNPEFINKIISDWNDEIECDYVVDTSNDIKNEDIENIINTLNENQ